jgi:hypothetical protein
MRVALRPVGDRRWRMLCWAYVFPLRGRCAVVLANAAVGLLVGAATFSGGETSGGPRPSGPSGPMIAILFGLGCAVIGYFTYDVMVRQVARANDRLGD